jgi:hypothetical protein
MGKVPSSKELQSFYYRLITQHRAGTTSEALPNDKVSSESEDLKETGVGNEKEIGNGKGKNEEHP